MLFICVFPKNKKKQKKNCINIYLNLILLTFSFVYCKKNNIFLLGNLLKLFFSSSKFKFKYEYFFHFGFVVF